MAYTIDTSVWVSAFLEGEPSHRKAQKFISKVIEKEEEIIIPVTVYIEVVMAISRRDGSQISEKRVAQYLLKLSNIVFVEIDYQRMIGITENVSKLKLRGMDAIIVGVTQEYDTQLVTLDEELAQRAKTLVEAVNLKA